MLSKHKIKKYVSLLIVLFLIFQVIPSTFANVKCLDSHAPKSPIIFSTSAVHTDITFLTRDGRKTTFHSISSEFYDSLTGQIYFVDISENKSFYHAAFPDYRKEIKQAIPHYFHGSKYKDSSLVI